MSQLLQDNAAEYFVGNTRLHKSLIRAQSKPTEVHRLFVLNVLPHRINLFSQIIDITILYFSPSLVLQSTDR